MRDQRVEPCWMLLLLLLSPALPLLPPALVLPLPLLLPA
jgi:hypothetical protein